MQSINNWLDTARSLTNNTTLNPTYTPTLPSITEEDNDTNINFVDSQPTRTTGEAETTSSALFPSLASILGTLGSSVIALHTAKPIKGFGITKNINDHEENKKRLNDYKSKAHHFINNAKPNRLDISDLLLDHADKQPDHKSIKYEKKPAKGCGMCGGNMDLLVHDKNLDDYTCKNCYDKEKITAGRFNSKNTKIYPIEESKHSNHIQDKKQHDINAFLIALEHNNPKTKFEEFDESSPIDKNFLRRYSKDYVMDRPPLKKDINKLAYLLGMREHAPEFMTTPLKANLQKMIFNHLDQNNFQPTIPQLDKFNNFDEIKTQLEKRGGFLHHYRV
jgi:hypothetical protein